MDPQLGGKIIQTLEGGGIWRGKNVTTAEHRPPITSHSSNLKTKPLIRPHKRKARFLNL